ncbi:unnamed protein product [Discosporangium mesarthrocarpum]
MPCRFASMCPAMDLVASVHADGQLSVCRTISWQRSFNLSLEDMGNCAFSCATWSPDGKSLAVGYTDGTIQLLGVETGAEECSLDLHEGRPLAAMTWVAQQRRDGKAYTLVDHEADQLAEVMGAYANRCEHLLGPSDALLKGGAGGGLTTDEELKAEDGSSLLQGMRERPVSVLATADISGVVVLSICGAYQLTTIDLKHHRANNLTNVHSKTIGSLDTSKMVRQSHRGQELSANKERVVCSEGGLQPLQLTLSADLGLLSALVQVDGAVELIQVDLPVLWSRRHELKPLAVQYTAFQALLKRLASQAPRAPQIWVTALQPLEKKLGVLDSLLSSYGYHEDISPRDELLHLVVCGFTSDALNQFFSNNLTVNQLVRMQKTIEAGTAQVETILGSNISFLARTLLFHACDMQRLALLSNSAFNAGLHGGDGNLGLSPAAVQALLAECEGLW